MKYLTRAKMTAVRIIVGLLVIATVFGSTAPAVQAQAQGNAVTPPATGLDPWQLRVYQNDVYTFDWFKGKASKCGATNTSTNSGSTGAGVTGENARIAYEFFVSKGLAPFRAAAIVGNLYHESAGVNPRINQIGGGKGRGIAQWSVDGRWATFLLFAQGGPRDPGDRDPYDLVTQLDFVWYELNGSYKSALAALQGATDMKLAVNIITDQYEQAGVKAYDARLRYAQQTMDLYGKGAPTNGPAATGGTSPASADGATYTGTAGATSCNGGGSFSGAPGQTVPAGTKGGFSLGDNTDYSATPCAPGTTETQIYRHPVRGFQIRLCKIGNTSIVLASIISDRALALVNAAAGAGISLNGGGFRSYEEQLKIYNGRGCPCNPPVAKPGNSQHERGLAIDFSGNYNFGWLSANAAQFGFYNLPSEAWHWSMSGN